MIEIDLDEAAHRILRSAVSGLYEWRQPDRPEDLCFLRADGSTWLGTIAHERDAFLMLTAEEAADLAAFAPAVFGLLRLDEGEDCD